MSARFDLRRILMSLAAPALAIVVAILVTSVILVVAGDPVGEVWSTILSVPRPRVVVAIINHPLASRGTGAHDELVEWVYRTG